MFPNNLTPNLNINDIYLCLKKDLSQVKQMLSLKKRKME